MKFRHKKSLGQHFLRDQTLLHALVDEIQPQPHEHLIEIGPGEGVLSRQLSGLCRRLSLIELDDRMVTKLRLDFAERSEVDIIHANALTYDYTGIMSEPVRIVGNLPYNISSQLILKLIAFSGVTEMYFVIQKEVAQRLCAHHGDRNYGRITLMMQIYCQAELLLDLPPEAFDPSPKVWSSLVRLVRIPCAMAASEKRAFADVVRLAFGQRRKQIANSLKAIVTPEQLRQLGISSQARAEELSLQDYLSIATLSR